MQHIDSGSTLRNFKLTISYDGRQFHGWQIQNNAMTVQEAFQTALSKIIGDDFDLKGCSRTDSGVHANMYTPQNFTSDCRCKVKSGIKPMVAA